MKFTINHNRDKAQVYANALIEAGHEEILTSALDLERVYHPSGMTYIQNPKDADFIIVDHNWTEAAIGTLRWAKNTGRPAFKIIHGARADMFIDSIKFPNPMELVNFVPGPGHKRIYDAGGYPAETVVTGWAWSDVKEFTPSLPTKVLFAPIHPREKAKLIPGQRHANVKIIKDLKRLSDKYDIHIYQYKQLKDNALPEDTAEWATLHQSTLKLADAIAAIEDADLVIAHETFSFISIALGKPTIMFRDDVEGIGWFVIHESKYWPHYNGKMNYPFSWMTHTGDKDDLIRRVAMDREAIMGWKQNFIGGPFDKEVFVNTIQPYLEE